MNKLVMKIDWGIRMEDINLGRLYLLFYTKGHACFERQSFSLKKRLVQLLEALTSTQMRSFQLGFNMNR